jgi:hypothetical protein
MATQGTEIGKDSSACLPASQFSVFLASGSGIIGFAPAVPIEHFGQASATVPVREIERAPRVHAILDRGADLRLGRGRIARLADRNRQQQPEQGQCGYQLLSVLDIISAPRTVLQPRLCCP